MKRLLSLTTILLPLLASGCLTLTVGSATARRGETVPVPVAMTAGEAAVVESSAIGLGYDPAVLEWQRPCESALSNFTSGQITDGEVRTASAASSGDVLEAGSVVLSCRFRVRDDAPLGASAVSLVRLADPYAPGSEPAPLLAGPIVGSPPRSVPIETGVQDGQIEVVP